jgi:hypothetical protein
VGAAREPQRERGRVGEAAEAGHATRGEHHPCSVSCLGLTGSVWAACALLLPQIRSFELGVLCTPTTEARYLVHPHRGFVCSTPPLGCNPYAALRAMHRALPQGGPPPRVQLFSLTKWELEKTGAAAVGADAVAVFAPLPYKLPPARYTANDRPW